MNRKKKGDLSVLLEYAGSRRGLTLLGLVLSALSMLLSMAPYICIWLVARDLIAVAPNWGQAQAVSRYGWLAFGFAVGGILLYFAGLMCTHLAAFRTAANIRKQGGRHVMNAPLGYFDVNASGLIRGRPGSGGWLPRGADGEKRPVPPYGRASTAKCRVAVLRRSRQSVNSFPFQAGAVARLNFLCYPHLYRNAGIVFWGNLWYNIAVFVQYPRRIGFMKKTFQIFPLLALMGLLLCGCGMDLGLSETTEPAKIERISMVVDEESILTLEQDYPDLKEADLTGSECYQAIEAYAARNPQVTVTYLVRLGTMAASPDAESLDLGAEDYEYRLLLSNLAYLPNLQKVTLRDSALTPEELQALQNAYPNVQFECGLNFCGVVCDSDTTELDLSGCSPEEVLENAASLSYLPSLETIELMAADGSTAYTLEQAAQLQVAVPEVLLRFTFELFDKNVSTTDEEIRYANQYIGNQEGALDTLRTALTVLRGCNRFVLDNCHFTNEELAELRDEFRDTTKVVWRVWFAKGGCLTDRKVIRYVYNLYDSHTTDLIYCEDAEFIDFGHNEYLKQCDFVAGMPNLRAIILSGSMVSDLTPFENCPNLEFLELAYCGYLEDLSPLASCTNLVRLNIAYTKVSDLSALDNLNLEVMVDTNSQTSETERARFDDLHPDCIVQHTGSEPYSYPWRYEKSGEANEYYAILKEEFGYPDPTDTLS